MEIAVHETDIDRMESLAKQYRDKNHITEQFFCAFDNNVDRVLEWVLTSDGKKVYPSCIPVGVSVGAQKNPQEKSLSISKEQWVTRRAETLARLVEIYSRLTKFKKEIIDDYFGMKDSDRANLDIYLQDAQLQHPQISNHLVEMQEILRAINEDLGKCTETMYSEHNNSLFFLEQSVCEPLDKIVEQIENSIYRRMMSIEQTYAQAKQAKKRKETTGAVTWFLRGISSIFWNVTNRIVQIASYLFTYGKIAYEVFVRYSGILMTNVKVLICKIHESQVPAKFLVNLKTIIDETLKASAEFRATVAMKLRKLCNLSQLKLLDYIAMETGNSLLSFLKEGVEKKEVMAMQFDMILNYADTRADDFRKLVGQATAEQKQQMQDIIALMYAQKPQKYQQLQKLMMIEPAIKGDDQKMLTHQPDVSGAVVPHSKKKTEENPYKTLSAIIEGTTKIIKGGFCFAVDFSTSNNVIAGLLWGICVVALQTITRSLSELSGKTLDTMCAKDSQDKKTFIESIAELTRAPPQGKAASVELNQQLIDEANMKIAIEHIPQFATQMQTAVDNLPPEKKKIPESDKIGRIVQTFFNFFWYFADHNLLATKDIQHDLLKSAPPTDSKQYKEWFKETWETFKNPETQREVPEYVRYAYCKAQGSEPRDCYNLVTQNKPLIGLANAELRYEQYVRTAKAELEAKHQTEADQTLQTDKDVDETIKNILEKVGVTENTGAQFDLAMAQKIFATKKMDQQTPPPLPFSTQKQAASSLSTAQTNPVVAGASVQTSTRVAPTLQPRTMPLGQVPTPLATGMKPSTMALGQVPTPLATGMKPSTMPLGQVPTALATGMKPSTMPLGQVPTPLATGMKPSTMPLGQVPAPLATGMKPSTMPLGQVPAALATGMKPSTMPLGQVPAALATGMKPSTMPFRNPNQPQGAVSFSQIPSSTMPFGISSQPPAGVLGPPSTFPFGISTQQPAGVFGPRTTPSTFPFLAPRIIPAKPI